MEGSEPLITNLETSPTAARRPRAVVYRGTVLATADIEATPEQVFQALIVAAATDGIVVEIDPPRMIVQKWKRRGDSEETTVTFSLASVSNGTRVTVRHEGFVNRQPAAEEYMRGWEETLAGIQSRLKGGEHVESSHDHP